MGGFHAAMAQVPKRATRKGSKLKFLQQVDGRLVEAMQGEEMVRDTGFEPVTPTVSR